MLPRAPQTGIPTLGAIGIWGGAFQKEAKTALEQLLPDFLRSQRWFGGKARALRSVTITDVVSIPYDSAAAELLFLQLEYAEGTPEIYILSLACAAGSRAERILAESPHIVVARISLEIHETQHDGVLYDALWDEDFSCALLDAMGHNAQYKGHTGKLAASHTGRYRELIGSHRRFPATVVKTEQSNTSVRFGDQVILKLYRRPGEGINPDLEIGRVLTDLHFPSVPLVAGSIEYGRQDTEPTTIGMLQAFVPNKGDAWRHALNAIHDYFGVVARCHPKSSDGQESVGPLFALATRTFPLSAQNLIGDYLDAARLLGQRTAELHRALSQNDTDPLFVPEPFTLSYRRSRYESMCRLAEESLHQLHAGVSRLPEGVLELANHVLGQRLRILSRFQSFLNLEATSLRIRCHGDYHLGQILWTGKDFVIIDFEGEPARPLSERRAKHSPLLDVAGMVRSFHYAPYAALHERSARPDRRADDPSVTVAPWADFWYRWVSAAFLKGYVTVASSEEFWPQAQDELLVLFHTHLLEKSMYELGYELNTRPTWVSIPLQGIVQLLEDVI